MSNTTGRPPLRSVPGGAARRTALPVPEPSLTPQEMIARAVAMRPQLRAEQDESDARGAYSPEMHDAFAKAGFYRITQPRLFGGYEFDLTTFYKVMLEIARGHPGSAWCLALGASHAFEIASHWSEQAQVELFGSDGHFIAPHRAPPLGTLTPVDGGYLFRGQWDYCSGVPYCTHFIGGALIKREGQPPVVGHAAVPRSAITIIDDWGGDKVLGMRASGSNSVRVEETFVPEHHVGYLSPGLAGTPESMIDGTAGTRLHGNPMYLGRLAGPFHITLVMPVVGAARAALDEYEEIITTRKTLSMPAILRFEHADFQRSYGQALTLTDAAEGLMIRVCEMYHDYCRRWAEHGTPITTEETMRLWGMAQHAGRMACEAVELLFHTGGSSPARKGHKLQRYFNDVAMYRGHSSAQGAAFGSGLARLHFGLPWGMYGL
ncbi:MAG TPA: acyl-CoA dehydrogenase family protein [Xanthobacteraceae bacterium]|nr:acyl-CoA dehydrogenase family protein [Xanthobacteraceae bacterium]